MFRLVLFSILFISFKANTAPLLNHSAFVDSKNMYVTYLGDTCNRHSMSLVLDKACTSDSKKCDAVLNVASTRIACQPGVKAHTESISLASLNLPKKLKQLSIFASYGNTEPYKLIMSKKRRLGLAVSGRTLYVTAKNCTYLRPKLTVEDDCRSDRQGGGSVSICYASLALDDSDGSIPCRDVEKELVVSKMSMLEARVDKRAPQMEITHKAQSYIVRLK